MLILYIYLCIMCIYIYIYRRWSICRFVGIYRGISFLGITESQASSREARLCGFLCWISSLRGFSCVAKRMSWISQLRFVAVGSQHKQLRSPATEVSHNYTNSCAYSLSIQNGTSPRGPTATLVNPKESLPPRVV